MSHTRVIKRRRKKFWKLKFHRFVRFLIISRDREIYPLIIFPIFPNLILIRALDNIEILAVITTRYTQVDISQVYMQGGFRV